MREEAHSHALYHLFRKFKKEKKEEEKENIHQRSYTAMRSIICSESLKKEKEKEKKIHIKEVTQPCALSSVSKG